MNASKGLKDPVQKTALIQLADEILAENEPRESPSGEVKMLQVQRQIMATPLVRDTLAALRESGAEITIKPSLTLRGHDQIYPPDGLGLGQPLNRAEIVNLRLSVEAGDIRRITGADIELNVDYEAWEMFEAAAGLIERLRLKQEVIEPLHIIQQFLDK